MATEPDPLAVRPNPAEPNIAASKPLHQYQHFIPQFLLKNFAHKYVAPDSHDTAKGQKRNAKTGMYSGEPAVNTLHLSGDFYLEECAVRRTCGMEDMYEDTENLLKDHGHLEKKFAAMESKASLIYRKIVKTYKNGKDNICLTRKDNDFLRKFMFLLTLRSVQYHRKYNLDNVQDYDGDDKVWLEEFMETYGLAKPLDVWFQSLETIIDIEIDPAGIWVELIKHSIYFPIADTFIDHMNKMYMTICTPEEHVDEFILTDNCCNVTEGKIAAYHIEAMMNHVDLAPCFHRFAPISPKLMIVLRYNLLPESIDSENPVATVRQQTQNETGFDTGNESILENLPIRKAMITPMEEVNGQLVPRIGKDKKLCECDNFYFTIFKISAEHVRTINSLLIDLAFHGSKIIFFRKKAFLNFIAWYLAEPCIIGEKLTEKHGAQQLSYIRGLFQFMRREGRDIPFKWPFELNEDGDLDQLHIRNVATTKFLEHPNHGKDGTGLDHKTLYEKLGGTDETFTSDMAAATIMFETWTMSVDLNYGSPEYESSCRKKLERLLIGHQGQSNTRFWLFLKKMRLGQAVASRAVHSVQGVALLVKPECQGSEDVLAYAHSIVSDKELNVAMYKAFNESIVMVRGAGNGLESMGHFSLFGSKKWRVSKPSGRGEPREVDKKKKETTYKKMVPPALPDNTNGNTSVESSCNEKQLDAKEKSDDDNKTICSLHPENTNETASTDSACKEKQLDAQEKGDADKKKEPSAGDDEPTETCDDDKTKDAVCANNTVCIEDTPTPSSLDEGTKKEEQTNPMIEDEPVLQKTPTKAVARKEMARHILPDNKKMWYVWATTVSCLLGSLGLFVLGVLGYLLSLVLRRFVWLLDNIAVASNNLRFALFPLAKYLLYVAIILIAFILGMTTIRKVFRK
ncbi:hypothetical protein H0G86_009222 [Trichoderma simmonsii]|uniref:Uncharacterized protein n=1 Tax=Trichoderma simmonsii TaxID=1491479 RepID=A0A8G0LM52_9HYPO|nr:hypothetical protein H0G86_009222 [Trichoderma simmonsii]